MKIIDLTLTISDKIPTFPGSPKPHFIEWETIPKDGYNLELLFLSSHTGTHIDAPFHFVKNGKKIPTDWGMELLETVGLTERKDHLPSQLSGGERLRTAVVRALINQPDILLADEPTGNLDIENARKLIDLLLRINRDFGQTIVLTTHNPEVAEIGHVKYELCAGQLRII